MKVIELNKQQRQEYIADIKQWFQNEMEEEISDFKAGSMLDFIMAKLGLRIYNLAIGDAHKLMTGLVEEIYTLEKRAR